MNIGQFKKAMKRIHKINPKACYNDAITRWDKSRMANDYIELYMRIQEGLKW